MKGMILILAAALCSCVVEPEKSGRPYTAGSGVKIEQGEISVDMSGVIAEPGQCGAGKYLKRNNADNGWECAEVEGAGGDITSVVAGSGLEGGGTEGAVSLSVVFGGSGEATTVSRSDHDHDGRYYTEGEVDGKLEGKSDTGHGHAAADVSDFGSACVAAVSAEGVPWTNVEGVTAETEWPGKAEWSRLSGVPEGFADGVDNVGHELTEDEVDDYVADNGYAAQTALDAHKSSSDHDGRYYKKEEADSRFQQSGEYLTIASLKELTGLSSVPDASFGRDLRNAITQECPVGYERKDDVSVEATGYYCRKAMGGGKHDEVVKVGDFWADRYEATIWTGSDCTGTRLGATDGDAHAAGFTRNGSDLTIQAYACSISGVEPSRYITWFQAQQACSFSGKHLCTNSEWQAAAYGTDDRTGADASGYCNINNNPAAPVNTGSRANCKSRFGAYDMVGNLWEWASNWYGQGANSTSNTQGATEFHGDGAYNVDYAEYNGTYGGGTAYFPAAALRGGYWDDAAASGVFALSLDGGPASWGDHIGGRCCRR